MTHPRSDIADYDWRSCDGNDVLFWTPGIFPVLVVPRQYVEHHPLGPARALGAIKRAYVSWRNSGGLARGENFLAKMRA